MTARTEWAGATHTGLVRDHNEDNFFISPEHGVGFVADGMGGHDAGEVASALAVEVVRQAVEDREEIATALVRAHQAILRHPRGGGRRGMGTTGVMVRIEGTRAEVGWAGDSRAYLFDGGALTPLTKDHTPVQLMVDRGVLTPEDARVHSRRNEILQALGVPGVLNQICPGEAHANFGHGCVLLLCSDGLTEHLNDARICQLLARGTSDLQATARRLIDAALDDGGVDNITVVLAKSVR